MQLQSHNNKIVLKMVPRLLQSAKWPYTSDYGITLDLGKDMSKVSVACKSWGVGIYKKSIYIAELQISTDMAWVGQCCGHVKMCVSK